MPHTTSAQRFLNIYATGTIVAGGTNPIANHSIRCIRDGKPLFVMEGTGGPAQEIANVMRVYKRFYAKNAPRKNASIHEIARAINDEFELEKRFAVLARNFPEKFNPSTTLIVDLRLATVKTLPVERLQDRITMVMSCVYEQASDLGSQESEVKALAHAASLMTTLVENAQRFRKISNWLMALLRFLILLAASLAIAEVWLEQRMAGRWESPRGTFIEIFLPRLEA